MSEPMRLGLLVRSAPWCGRSGRDQLDLATAAAVLGAELDLFFIGSGLLHLLDDRAAAAGLPANQRAWRALGELTVVRAWAEEGLLPVHLTVARDLLPGLRFVSTAEMPALQNACQRLLVL